MTGKILLVHIWWILIARGDTNPFTGSTSFVTGKDNYFVSQEEYFLWRRKMKNPSIDRKYSQCTAHSTPFDRKNCHMIRYTHVTRKTPCDMKNNSCDKRICHRRIFSCESKNIHSESLLTVTGIKCNTLCHNTFFLWMKEYFLSLEMFILLREEQRTPCVTWRIFHGAGGLSFNGLKTPQFDF